MIIPWQKFVYHFDWSQVAHSYAWRSWIDQIFVYYFRLDADGNIKVGDFGLAEDVYIRGYFRQDKYDAIKVPFRWMSPESLRDGLFSEKSDVVSFLQV